MANGRTAVLEKKTIAELTREARKAKVDLEGYLEDLELYSNPEFWQAVMEAESGKIKTFKSVKEYAKKMAKK